MKRIFAFLLALCMALSLIACGQQAETPDTTPAPQEQTETPQNEPAAEPVAAIADPIPYDEYERGIWYGFLPDGLADADPDATVVTWRQMCYMLGKFIERYQPESLPAWEEQTSIATDTPMKRDGGMIALLLAAKACDIDYANRGDYPSVIMYDGYELEISTPGSNYPIRGWNVPYILWERDSEWYQQRDDVLMGAYHYCFGFRASSISLHTLLEMIDGEPHLNYDLTLRMALTAVTRLYESNDDVAFEVADALLEWVKQTPEAQPILAAAGQRRAEICASETKIVKSDEYIQGETYTGTAYYISNSGDDANDGLSPETAWATVARLASADFAFGDAVFFERGGVWREVQFPENLHSTDGLTYSAYGTGEKPRLYGSPENGAGAEKWELYYEGANGEKIWKFHRDMPETTAVVMNDGETYAKRDAPYWNGTEYVLATDFSVPYQVERELADMRFFIELLYPAKAFEPSHIFYAGFENGVHTFVEGALYLRCDAGNPGKIYESIEFSTVHCPYDGSPNHTTFDNLNFSYGGSVGSGGSPDTLHGMYIYIQNCEMGWVGGKISWYANNNNSEAQSSSSDFYGWLSNMSETMLYFQDGGGANVQKSHERVLNNYIHHQFQDGVVLETGTQVEMQIEDNLYAGNLVEYCGLGMMITNWDAELKPPHIFSDIHFEDNMILYSGFENLYTKPQIKYRGTDPVAFNGNLRESHTFGTNKALNAHDGTLTVSGNTFAFAAGELFEFGAYTEEYPHIFDNNTYVQLPGMLWLLKHDYPEAPNRDEYYADPDAAIRDWVRDEHATIIRFDQ